MTHDQTPPPACRRRIYAALVLACVTTACSVALHPAGEPTRPAPAPTATPIPTITPTPVVELPSPSPIPRLVHLDVPADADDDRAPAVASPSAGRAPVPASGSVALERRGDFLVAPARIGDRALGDVLLDTGAGATFVDQGLADEMQLPEIIAASTAGARANSEASIRELHGLTAGDIVFAADQTFVVDLSSADALIGARLAGVIGFPTLGSAPFTLDFTTATLTVHADATFEPPAGVQAEALRVDQGLPFVEATLADGTAVWLLLDTGSAAAITVWRGFAKQHPGALHPSSPQPAATPPETTGNAQESELRSLRLFGERYDRIPALVEDTPARPWQRARVVGRVGMAMLRDLRLTIHPATERIWVKRPRRTGGE